MAMDARWGLERPGRTRHSDARIWPLDAAARHLLAEHLLRRHDVGFGGLRRDQEAYARTGRHRWLHELVRRRHHQYHCDRAVPAFPVEWRHRRHYYSDAL